MARTEAPTTTAWPAASSSDDVRRRLGDDLAAPRHVRHLAHQVAHRAAGHEQAGLLAEQLGGALLERDDGRVVPEHVVADLGIGHGAAHLGGGVRDGVGAQVDEVGHGHRRIARLPDTLRLRRSGPVV